MQIIRQKIDEYIIMGNQKLECPIAIVETRERVSQKEASTIAEFLISIGTKYIVFTGPFAEEDHDLIDVELEQNNDLSIVTTYHTDDDDVIDYVKGVINKDIISGKCRYLFRGDSGELRRLIKRLEEIM